MAKEIERKYLVNDDSYKELATATRHIVQGYISRRKEGTVRIRISDGRAILTIKGATENITRDEWEYGIPLADAHEMLRTVCEGNIIEKIRHLVPFDGLIWEIDEFIRPIRMTIAEVELPSASYQPATPAFIGEEVSGNPVYYNANM